MIEQYLKIKKEYADCILFFRLGDFYEMFFEDAETASRELDIVLTSRDGGKSKVPMCGVPYHAYANYVGKLLDKGYRVAICEQMEDPRQAKGIVEREVIRVITPGTALDDAWLTEDNNYLAAIVVNEDKAGLAYVDVLTGEFKACQLAGARARSELRDELARLRPSECLIPRWSSQELKDFVGDDLPGTLLTEVDPELFLLPNAREKLDRYLGFQSELLQELERMNEPAIAAGALIGFVEQTQRMMMNHLCGLSLYNSSDFLGLDRASRQNLELICNLRDGSRDGSLLGQLNHTCTAMGCRRLRIWLEQPLIDITAIENRLDSVAELLENPLLRQELQGELKKLRDIERIAGKIGAGVVNPRELLALKSCLEAVPELKGIGREIKSSLLRELFMLNEMESTRDLISRSIDDSAPPAIRDGGVIKAGYDQRVDELRHIAFEGDSWLLAYEQSQKERTQIKSLKVGFNRVFGYYIEVTKANTSQVPADYIRKQTLVNAERYITEELKTFENQVLGARERLLAVENHIFQDIKLLLQDSIEDIKKLSSQLAQIDALISLAEAAFVNNYTRPHIKKRGVIAIKGGRHPMVEKTLREVRFVPNDCTLDPEGHRVGIVTGPNMGGKSTFLRQAALIVIMAQMGSFVPADEAAIGLVDQVFTRVGASDDLSSGKSTFMVEMVEVANILKNATSRSLIILDEVGRGTSTFDGVSIARALAEYLANIEGIRVLFATHYHELTDLAENFSGVFNLCVSVKEVGEEVIFLRKVLPGKADKSYGIHVAKLAGLPAEVTKRAEIILDSLEEQRDSQTIRAPLQPSLFSDEEHPVIDALRAVNTDSLSPLEALTLLYSWKQML